VAQEEFRTTLYSIGDGVITTDTKGLVKHMKPAAERFLPAGRENEAVGKPLEQVFPIINKKLVSRAKTLSERCSSTDK